MSQRKFMTWLPAAAVATAAIAFAAARLSLAHDMKSHAVSPNTENAALDAENPFLTGNDAAMNKMMAGMAIKPTGDVDTDFVAMMVPHHQGAIDMAKLVLRYGHNNKLKYLAQEIVVTQQQEIAAMRQAVGEPLPPSMPSPTATNSPAGQATAAMAGAMPMSPKK